MTLEYAELTNDELLATQMDVELMPRVERLQHQVQELLEPRKE